MSNPFASYLKQESTPCTVEIQFKIGNKSVQKLAAVCLGRGEKAAKAGALYTFFFLPFILPDDLEKIQGPIRPTTFNA